MCLSHRYNNYNQPDILVSFIPTPTLFFLPLMEIKWWSILKHIPSIISFLPQILHTFNRKGFFKKTHTPKKTYYTQQN